MATPATEHDTPPNSLGLDFEQKSPETPKDEQPAKDEQPVVEKEKKKPYVNPERVKTGGEQRDKLSEDALSERMARIREQNDKIKQRRAAIEEDEKAFRKTQESERAKLAHNKKVQENVDRTREQNAQRKLKMQQNREWDSNKPAGGGGTDWKQKAAAVAKTAEGSTPTPIASPPADATAEDGSKGPGPNLPPSSGDSWVRGAGRSPRGSRGRGGTRGRGNAPTSPTKDDGK